jgi:pimeloyl-ACP methyl ester carboxylesterase
MRLTVDGKAVFAATGGRPFDPAQPAIVFLHGAAMDHTAWVLQTRYFAHHGYGVLAVDLPGHGRSEGKPLVTVGDLADWLIRLLDAAQIGRASIVGHSMGALVGLEAARRHPDRVAALALLGVAYPMPVNDDFLALARNNDHLAIDLMADWAHSPRSHVGGHKVPGLHMIGGAERLVERAGPGVQYACLKACNDYAEGDDAVRSLQCPVAFILGERDLMTPARAGRKLADMCGNATVTEIAGAGHMMMVETPDAVLDALKAALERGH